VDERLAAIEAGLQRLQQDLGALRSLVIATDEHAQRKLKAGLASAVNLISILPELKIEGVLPPFPHRGFEVTGELAVFMFHLVRRHRPKLIVELGGGSSTVLFAAALRANGAGRVISVESDPEHLKRTAQYLRQSGLAEWTELIEAPLMQQSVGSLSMQWYDTGPLLRALREEIDLLFVDGPPGKLQSFSRYPAFPLLQKHLSARALVLVDDGRREDEARMVELWRDCDTPFEAELLGFLPRAPILLTMRPAEASVTELRQPAAGDAFEPTAARRSGAA
jgi:predicted O-methyltransferase YrrM